MNKLSITSNRWKALIIPAVIIIAGIVMYFVNGGFNFDVEFIGGSRIQVQMPEGISNDEVQEYLSDTLGVNVTVQSGEEANTIVVKAPPIEGELDIADASADDEAADTTDDAADTADDETADNSAEGNPVFTALQEKYDLEDSALIDNTTASASFGSEVQRKALLYTLIAIICILIYIAIRFEWKSAVMAVMGLAINVLVMFAVYSITNIAVNTTFIAAMLTVIGYSINNTIVIFDRIRENMKGRRKGETIFALTDRSVSETLGRTINSTVTTLIMIVLIYILGVSTIKDFALPLIVGILIGAYTSIFISPAFWAVWRESAAKQKALAAQERKSSKKKNK
ncbi:MAG: protein translocase subunit SecF [Firmicutes bacterium]|nr:protein translocase subunit SecF [Bacillota bacterium]